ncbi:MAG: hypothetical protein ACFE0Q_20760 [Anaerolineae bacterium]
MRQRLLAILLAFVLSACTLDTIYLVFVDGDDRVTIPISPATNTPAPSATPTVVPSATLSAMPTAIATIQPSATPSPIVTVEPSPTQESLPRIRISFSVNIRNAPNGSVCRVASAQSTFTVFARQGDWLQLSDSACDPAWVFNGSWVTVISGSLDDLREVQASQRDRISYNVNALAVPNWTYLYEHLERLQPSSILVMDDWRRACEMKQRFPEMVVISRDFSILEGEEWELRPNEQDWLNRWRNEGCYEVLRYTTNEPSMYNPQAFADSEVELMRAAQAEGIRLSVGNFGVGTIPMWAVEQGVFDEWLRAIVDGDHIIGAHEYTTGVLPFGVGTYSREQLLNPVTMQPANWITDLPIAYRPFGSQTTEELDPVTAPFGAYEASQELAPVLSAQSASCGELPTYWHILRTTWFLLRAECIGLNPDDIEIILTEGLWDNLNDIDTPEIQPVQTWREQYGIDRYMRDMRGIPSYENLWRAYYPQWTTAEAAFCQMIWWNDIAPEQYIGVQLFTWSTNNLWISFDVSGVQASWLYELHDLLETYRTGADMRDVCGDYAWAS